ncbi:MAG: molybdopterin-dependent oxidoreductase [Fimbriimonas sp.]|nr:molybdopterin-dependent oxidoreductase [Fimbriimonas sp.]
MSNRLDISRRSFIQIVGGVGASLALASFSSLACADLGGAKAAKLKKGVVFAPNAFVKVDPDGLVTVSIIAPDAGQGSRTSLAMLVAEELDVDWHNIRVTQAPTDSAVYGNQGIGGSHTIVSLYQELREIGAATRAMLIAAAAKTWEVDPTTLKTAKGHVISADGKKSVAYGDLTAMAATMPLPTVKAELKKSEAFNLIGKGATRVDNPDVVTGRAKYGLDVKVPGMVYAVVARTPAFGASIKSFDDSATKKVPGVLEVVQIPSGVAVVGTNTWAALSGRQALKIDWEMGSNADLNSAKITEAMKAAVEPHPDMPAGSKSVEASLQFPYLAHATMEPLNAVADVQEGRCTIWTGSQQPTGHQKDVAGLLKIPVEQVTLNVMLLGGGFGRRLYDEYIIDAVNVSKAIKKPVKLMWTREDDMKHDNYRPACFCSFRGAVDGSGNPVGWSHQAIQAGMGGRPSINYDIANASNKGHTVRIGVPTGPWRSVENTLFNVANECFIDELAHASGKDPFEFRRALLKDDRLRKVLEVAAEKSDWSKPLPAGHGRGIACFHGYGSYAAHVIELSIEGNKIRLHKATCVVDCGIAVNPKGVEAQMQGACTDGLSTALRAEITIDKGGVVQDSWTDYRWMTLDAMPKVEVTILQGGDSPGGMGEVGYPSVAPAVANAVFAATGKRVRKFPIKVEELV